MKGGEKSYGGVKPYDIKRAVGKVNSSFRGYG